MCRGEMASLRLFVRGRRSCRPTLPTRGGAHWAEVSSLLGLGSDGGRYLCLSWKSELCLTDFCRPSSLLSFSLFPPTTGPCDLTPVYLGFTSMFAQPFIYPGPTATRPSPSPSPLPSPTFRPRSWNQTPAQSASRVLRPSFHRSKSSSSCHSLSARSDLGVSCIAPSPFPIWTAAPPKQERKAAELEAQRRQAEEELKANGGKPDEAERERVQITELCRSLNVEMKEINPDGHW